MEHIYIRAKEELLSIDDDPIQEHNDNFFSAFNQSCDRLKKNIAVKNTVSRSTHHQKNKKNKENNKQTLKQSLKELLQTQIASPKISLNRLETIASFRTNNHSKTTSKIQTLHLNEKTSRFSQFQKLPFFSLLRQNQSSLNKRLNPTDSFEMSKKNLFDQQNSLIRKIIKKKMQQKASQKQQRILPLTNTIQNVKKFKTRIYQRILTEQNNQENSLMKQRRANRKLSSTKFLRQKIIQKELIYNKQNLDCISSTPSIKRQRQNCLESRKLKNLLF